jgi:hypothetical protein
MRIRSRLLPLAVVATLAVSGGNAAGATGGSLTSAEYQQLSSEQARTETVKGSELQKAEALLWACEQIQVETPLLTEERASCDDILGYTIAALHLKSGASACVLKNPTVATRLTCLLGVYTPIYNAAQGLDVAEARLQQIVQARKFDASCAAFLGPTALDLQQAGRVAAAFKLLVSDIRSDHLTSFASTSRAADDAWAELSRDLGSGPTKLSVCPHQ